MSAREAGNAERPAVWGGGPAGQPAAAGLLTEADVTAGLVEAGDRHVGIDGFTAAEAAQAVANGLAYGTTPVRRLNLSTEVGRLGA